MTDYNSLKALSQRDRDFMTACRKVISESTETDLTVDKVAARAAAMKAPAYYVEYSYAMRKLNALAARRAKLDSKVTCRRWEEIRSRVERLMELRGLKRNDALARVLREGDASSFFLAPRSATRLYLRLRHRTQRH